MRKAEFKNRVEKTKNKHGDLILSVYKASQYRWEETADPQTDDEKYFFTLEEAKEYLETVNMNIGFQGIVDKFEFEYTDFNNEFEFGSEGDIEDFLPSNTYPETIYYGDVFEGDDITGAIIVRWSYEKYVGYCRNLQDIGIAGEYPFHEFTTEKDLITGNEESTFRSNYSVLLTKDEVDSAENIKEAVEEELQKGHWKWNYFRNNPNSYHIAERLDELFGISLEEKILNDFNDRFFTELDYYSDIEIYLKDEASESITQEDRDMFYSFWENELETLKN